MSSFREEEKVNTRTDGRTHNGQQAMTYARWPMASGAKKLVMSIFPFPTMLSKAIPEGIVKTQDVW